MGKRNTKEDSTGEWMTLAQYKNAVAEDFGISISHTAISLGRDTGKILKKYCKTISGKQCINYTFSVLRLLKNSPKIITEEFESVENEFKIKHSKYFSEELSKHKKIKSKKVKKEEDEDSENYESYESYENSENSEEGSKYLNVENENGKPVSIEETEDMDAEISIVAEKAMHERIKRKKAELEYAIFEGKYVHTDDVNSALTIISVETRQAIFSIVPRIKYILTAETDAHKVEAILVEELELALNKLSSLQELGSTGTISIQDEDDEEEELEDG
jgi:hypothetical protein